MVFIVVGLLLNTFGRPIGILIDDTLAMIGFWKLDLVHNAWLYGRLGQIFIALGLLMLFDKLVNFKGELFLKIDRTPFQYTLFT